ncbi:4-hydroxythreonine-4-phosphate dehydrogenase PdxA [Vibrio natriegens]|jgi:4-hydroxythreonine-4-phosphate dehydrogenase|uniref:4-hydroxythreonine-4-phosphate dehydrogenase PdxA n=1 Tax=Vibrio TaxID=662 RepID=UPI000243B691|nr:MULTISPECIES: 4-hydroxythreonine-4-phosphate dehydrogenase PdxA [Vibrio]AEX24858.1 4-hydroxythreonine-4-phosphate dehydrogenase 2 [Vibrio sp. EJY3]MCG9701708.1 4-hydroxythreonine-4-phosphate dehydrogenase PdxA [Vibrio natriegens]MCY9876488.1 4-hydroxythreonine-4-phosphate dehydrogenase PdxA [Vibrio natriegens]MEE3877221.1 4-hydroxythreonine-4-phosphate dehydrogenase PdxA [Vibrio sp. YYF0003]
MKGVIGITMGDPAGIGPEIILKALAEDSLSGTNCVVIGSVEVLEEVLKQDLAPSQEINVINKVSEANFSTGVVNVIDIPLEDIGSFKIGTVQAQAGDLAYRCIEVATSLALDGEISAIATAPLNKEALHLAGHNYPGHTELLAKLTDTKDYAMVLYTDTLRVIHVTTHIALLKFLETLNQNRVNTVIKIADEFMKKAGFETPRIAVAGVNPHAGENGLFGTEEIEVLNPCIETMKKEGVDVYGPCPPDTVFLQASQGQYDIVVAMYHDQGHIPLKLMGFYDGVNITAGLPFFRTSADHGTAFDIAWSGKANPESMIKSVELAVKLSNV